MRLLSLFRKEGEPRELKRLSTWRRRNQIEILSVRATESRREQTESVQKWNRDVVFGLFFSLLLKSKSSLERDAIEGDSPVCEN